MTNPTLVSLQADEFQVPILFAPSPLASYRMLQKAPEVLRLRESLGQGAISDLTIRKFVAKLMQDLRQGERFRHEVVLAAIAVALESWGGGFADEYLNQLAALKVGEMSMSIRVAGECLKRRTSQATSQQRKSEVVTGQSPGPVIVLSYAALRELFPPHQENAARRYQCGV
jgi:hypothetical protein